MKIFLTGINGFLGRHVAIQLIKSNFDVVGLIRNQNIPKCLNGLNIDYCYGDLVDCNTYKDYIKKCDAVIHTAALTSFNLKNKDEAYLINTTSTKKLLDISVKYNIKRFIYIGTRGTLAVDKYPENSSEKNGYKSRDLMNTYLTTKYLAEKEVLKFGRNGELSSLVLSPTAMIGIFDDKPTPIGKILLAFLRGEVKTYMDGGINIVDVEDVAFACVKALSKGESGEVYIIGNKNISLYKFFEELSLVHLVKLPRIKLPLFIAFLGALSIQAKAMLTKKEPLTTINKVYSLYNNHSFCSSKKAINEFGINKIPLSTTITKTVNWFVEKHSL